MKSLNHLWVPHSDEQCRVCEIAFKKWNLHGRKYGRSSTLDESDYSLGLIFNETIKKMSNGDVDLKLEIPDKNSVTVHLLHMPGYF